MSCRARQLLDELVANGGRLHPQEPRADGLPSFLVDFEPGADRHRCREIIALAKAEPDILAAMLDLVSGGSDDHA